MFGPVVCAQMSRLDVGPKCLVQLLAQVLRLDVGPKCWVRLLAPDVRSRCCSRMLGPVFGPVE